MSIELRRIGSQDAGGSAHPVDPGGTPRPAGRDRRGVARRASAGIGHDRVPVRAGGRLPRPAVPLLRLEERTAPRGRPHGARQHAARDRAVARPAAHRPAARHPDQDRAVRARPPRHVLLAGSRCGQRRRRGACGGRGGSRAAGGAGDRGVPRARPRRHGAAPHRAALVGRFRRGGARRERAGHRDAVGGDRGVPGTEREWRSPSRWGRSDERSTDAQVPCSVFPSSPPDSLWRGAAQPSVCPAIGYLYTGPASWNCRARSPTGERGGLLRRRVRTGSR